MSVFAHFVHWFLLAAHRQATVDSQAAMIITRQVCASVLGAKKVTETEREREFSVRASVEGRLLVEAEAEAEAAETV